MTYKYHMCIAVQHCKVNMVYINTSFVLSLVIRLWNHIPFYTLENTAHSIRTIQFAVVFLIIKNSNTPYFLIISKAYLDFFYFVIFKRFSFLCDNHIYFYSRYIYFIKIKYRIKL